MKTKIATLACFTAISLLFSSAATASIMTYEGAGATAGLSATAEFQLTNGGNSLEIWLTNTSATPLSGPEQVLSSINLCLPVDVIGGTTTLNTGSSLVSNAGGGWIEQSWTGQLNDAYGFSNSGIGNHMGKPALLHNVTAEQLSLLDTSVTSQSDLGQQVTSFSGNGLSPTGLDFGLVNGQQAFGVSMFVKSSIHMTLDLGQALTDLSFLEDGSYVEFGSDYAYIGGSGQIPEPGSMMIWASLVACVALAIRRRR